MNEMQQAMWEFLCGLSGEEVARIFTGHLGNQVLDEELLQYIREEGYYLEPYGLDECSCDADDEE